MAKNNFLSWDTVAASNTDIGGIGVQGSNNVSNFDNAFREIMAQLKSGVDGEVVYAVQSGAYNPVLNDNNAVHLYSASATTVALTAAATLGANWHYTIIANNGPVTIDPNAAETINGAATFVVPGGSSATIICDGTNFFTVYKPNTWEPIGQGLYTGSAAATFDLTNLSAYRMIELRGFIFGSAAAGLWMRTSSNNGSSYDAGASDYVTQYDGYVNALLDNASGANSIIPLTGGAVVAAPGGLTFRILCSQFNQATNAYVLGELGVNTNSQGVYKVYGSRAQATARNALRFLMSTGTMTYFIEARGLRG